MPRLIHVVASVLEDDAGRVLIAQRPAGKSLAGAWEFPGGKLAGGEARLAGLERELAEELGIRVAAARPLIRYRHRYPDLEVDLDAWRVTAWEGEPHGREGQALAWRLPHELDASGLLPADFAIVNAIRLPPRLLVTPPRADAGEEDFLDRLEAAVAGIGSGEEGRRGFSPDNGKGSSGSGFCGSGFSRDPSGLKPRLSLICLRRPDLDASSLLELAAGAACRLEDTGARLLLHGDPTELAPMLADPPAALRARLGDAIAGLHVPARCLAGLQARPVPASLWFGASCHDAAELAQALAAGADYALLGPVKATASHPGASGMGWARFGALVRDLAIPVYGIGGLGEADLEDAWAAGAQGIAAIRGLWL